MRPTRDLFELAKAMFVEIWEHRSAMAKGQVKAITKRLNELDSQVEGLVDRLVMAATILSSQLTRGVLPI